MTSDELNFINKAAIADGISSYGTFLKEEMAKLLDIQPAAITVFATTGFVDVVIVPITTSTGNYIFYTLNSRWRNLRNCKTYEALLDWEKEQEKKQNEKLDLEYKLLQSQIDFQELNNKYISKQVQFMDDQESIATSQTKIQEAVKNFTFLVMLGTLIASGVSIMTLSYQLWHDRHHLAVKIVLCICLLLLISLMRVKPIRQVLRESLSKDNGK